jgi:hypothetical protein
LAEAAANYLMAYCVPRPRIFPPFAVFTSTPRQKAMPGVATEQYHMNKQSRTVD